MFYLILFAHWVGDFLCQSDWMAINKSKSFKALGLHVLVYTACLAGIFFVLDPFLIFESPWPILAFAGINGSFHFLIDAVTSRINSYLWQNEKRHAFFVMIGFDQLLHTALLLYTFEMLK